MIARLKACWAWSKYWNDRAKCFLFGHVEFNHYTFMCDRCAMTDQRVVDTGFVTVPEWLRRNFRIPAREVRNWTDGNMTLQKLWCVEIFGKRFGFERAPIYINGEKYMTRYIMYLGWINLRLHQFFRGDDDRASHTHPWWFITFPLSPYREEVYNRGVSQCIRLVKAWRFHYRPASFEHIVLGSPRMHDGKSFWTFVIAGAKVRTWGFYPEPGVFVPWWEFNP